MEKKAKWIDTCLICKHEVAAHIDHLKKISGATSTRDAARKISEDLGGELSANAIRCIYLRKKAAQSEPGIKSIKPFKNTSECKSVSSLDCLVESGEKFSTIYADPPWKYGNQATRSATDGEYQTMTYEEIAALPVSKLSSENSHLHLWTTNGFLHEAIHLISDWGFEYKSCLIWIKPQMGIGNYWRVSHEFLLLGVKGSMTFANHSIMSWIEARRTRHSAKPEKIRGLIERVSPGPYLELFGRHPVDGWTVFGNQIERNMFEV